MMAWITGAGGLIGHYLVQNASHSAPDWKVRSLTRAELDLTDFGRVRGLFGNELPGLVIHCAALTKTPACQKNPVLAQ